MKVLKFELKDSFESLVSFLSELKKQGNLEDVIVIHSKIADDGDGKSWDISHTPVSVKDLIVAEKVMNVTTTLNLLRTISE